LLYRVIRVVLKLQPHLILADDTSTLVTISYSAVKPDYAFHGHGPKDLRPKDHVVPSFRHHFFSASRVLTQPTIT